VASVILLTLLVKIGPLFLAFAFMSPTRFAAIGWIKTVAGCVVTQILVVAILSLFTATEAQMVPGIIAQAQAGGGANTVELVLSLCELGFLLFVTYSVTKQAAGLASGIVGGPALLHRSAIGEFGKVGIGRTPISIWIASCRSRLTRNVATISRGRSER